MVAAFLQRDATAFVTGSYDFLAAAINMARQASERQHDFELCKVKVDLVVSLTAGGDLTNAKLAGTSTAVRVKKVIKGFVPTAVTDGYIPVATITRAKHLHYLQRQADRFGMRPDIKQWPVRDSLLFLVRDTNTMYLTPADPTGYISDPVTIKMDVVRWLPEYTADTDTDFLLTDCTEYMLFKTVTLMQPFMKEDVRVPLAAAQLEQAWRTVIAWDSQLVVAGYDLTNLT